MQGDDGDAWARLTARQAVESTAWRPDIWPADAVAPGHRAWELLERGEIAFVHDTLQEQLMELLDTRMPRRPPPSATELEDAMRKYLGDRPLRLYGNWVHYPWSRRLVRVLPAAEFREVRTSRNRNKITATEQQRLAELDVAVVGLSVGRATALTLALEGVGGRFRLADFDILALSNLNRLRAGVHELGVNKAILTARAIAELDPYLQVSIDVDGVTEDSLETFLTEGGRVDLVFEECDDLEMKVRVREVARRLRIPVLMETSDRGMLDIERFDLEPDRPLFHGLAGDLDARSLRGLDTYQKVPTVGAILGLQSLSRRMAASLIDVDASIKTWPQLGSGVMLGGALNTEAARRIVLGELRQSGRYYVDLEQLIRDGQAAHAPSIEPPGGPSPPRPPLPTLHRGRGPIVRSEVEALVAHGVMAPSGGNAQPWHFAYEGNRLQCHIVPERASTLLDDAYCGSYLACGAAAEHLALAAPALNIDVRVELLPDPALPQLAFRAELSRASNEPIVDPLLAHVGRRCTNRKKGRRVPLQPEHRAAIVEQAVRHDAVIQLLEAPDALDAVAAAVARADRQRLLSPRLHREMFEEVRWSPQSAEKSRDGLDVATLELDPTERAGMTVLSSWEVMQTVRELGGGQGLERSARDAIASASAVGMLSFPGRGGSAFLAGGRALARVWLCATACGVAFQPMTALVYILRRIERGHTSDLLPEDIEVFRAAGRTLDELFPFRRQHERLMLFRLAMAPEPSARSLRRDVGEVLTYRASGEDPRRAT